MAPTVERYRNESELGNEQSKESREKEKEGKNLIVIIMFRCVCVCGYSRECGSGK
jgi:hypothetical protein